MTTQPNILDRDRLTTYTPNNSAGPFDIGFPIFDPTGADLVVELDGVRQVGNWTVSVAAFPGFWGAPNTWTGTISFAVPVSGTLVIEGARAPRRVSQYAEGRGIPARDANTELNMLWAVLRELYQGIKRTLRAPASDAPIDMTLPGKVARANKLLEFDGQGRPVTTRGFPDLQSLVDQAEGARDLALQYRNAAETSRDLAAQWAQNAHGNPVSGSMSGYSARHWADEAKASETAAASYASLLGIALYDFNQAGFAGDEDWNNP